MLEEKKKYKIPKEGENGKGFSQRQWTYNGVLVRESNIKIFHNMFMEALAKSWDFDLQRELLRKKDALTTNEKKRIETESKPLLKEIKELYNLMWGLRKNVRSMYNKSPQYREETNKRCRDSFAYWVTFFGWTNDPRLVSMGLKAQVPFIMTVEQERAANIIHECVKTRTSCLVEKSRAEGITELLSHYDVWNWLYTPGYIGGWGSRKEALVDKRNSPGTIFSRLRRIIYLLPKDMRPRGFEKENNVFDKILTIKNPDMDSYLIGEGGKNIGRGDRYTTAKVDEKSQVENPEAVDSALSETAFCQIDIATPNGQDHFYEKRMSGKVVVITLWWYKNPSKNPNWRSGKRPQEGECSWYEVKKLTKDSVVVAQEIDIDYTASVGGEMIPSDWVRAAIDFPTSQDGPKIGGLDIAAGGKDHTVYICRNGVACDKPVPIPFSSPVKAAWAASELAVQDNISTLVYDRNTLGESIEDTLKGGDRKVPFDLIGVYGQSKASDRLYDSEGMKGYERFRNLRAEMWWSLRKRFENTYLHVTGEQKFPEEELISIPSGDQELVNQLSSPRIMFCPNGKIGVESKKEMASRNVSSPDKADALSYAYYPMDTSALVLPSARVGNSQNHLNFILDKRMPIDMYVTLYHTNDMKVYLNVCAHDLNSRKLLVVGEFMFDFFAPDEIYRNAVRAAQGFPIVKWYGNKEIFEGLDKGKNTIWYQYKKAKIKIAANWKENTKVAVDTLDRMFRDDYLAIHEDCDRTMKHIRNWRNHNGRPQENMFFALCLAQLITGLSRKKVAYVPVEDYKKGYNIV